MDNTVDDVMISCKTTHRQNSARVSAGSAKLRVISSDIPMKSAS